MVPWLHTWFWLGILVEENICVLYISLQNINQIISNEQTKGNLQREAIFSFNIIFALEKKFFDCSFFKLKELYLILHHFNFKFKKVKTKFKNRNFKFKKLKTKFKNRNFKFKNLKNKFKNRNFKFKKLKTKFKNIKTKFKNHNFKFK